MPSVLFIGDVNVDLILGGLESPPLLDREITCSSFTLTMGSSVAITAANYAGLGGSASVAGLAGQDEYGRFMIEAMKRRGIDTSLIRTTSEVKTGVTVNLIYGGTRTQITYPGAIARFEDTSEVEANLARFTHVHFSGVYQQHRLRPKITTLLDRVRASGGTLSLDPQWDPRESWETLGEWLPRLDYFFVNADEARSITGETDELKAVGRLAESTRCPICKLGPLGVAAVAEGAELRVPTFRVPVVDTTGAGDAFAAGFLFARLEKGMGTRDALRFGNAVAARNCMGEGGVNACPPYEEILRFMESKGE